MVSASIIPKLNGYSTLSSAATLAIANNRTKNLSIEAGKQYYNDVAGRTITSYSGFSSSNSTATILSSEPISFEGENVLTPATTPDAEYLLYTLKYMQTSDINYVIVVTVEAMSAPQGGI